MLSLLFAVVLTAIAFPLLFAGGLSRYRQVTQFSAGAPLDPVPVLLVSLALLLLAASAATIALSSLGVIVVGSVHLAWGLLGVVLPFDPFGGGFTNPIVVFTDAVRDVWPDLSDGMFYFVPTGFGIAFGAVLLTAGMLARRRRAAGRAAGRLVTTVTTAAASTAGVALVLVGGSLVFDTQLRLFTGEVQVGGVLLLMTGALLLAVAAAGVRWSGLGAIVTGALLVIAAVVLVVEPFGLVRATRDLGRELSAGLQIAAPIGNLGVIGAALLGAGVGAAIRARRARPEPPIEWPATGPVVTAVDQSRANA